ncbi:hypothetical protein HCC61_25270 [Streptomyces sp. HNM0575]|uniref:hypothetical protein n=1 Tax=Streptomyces sp. HNM0575 TaxID=2716338 RepID=UPI00145E180B|nr:hypothetical protein [Streptomyces sp. HNM0575]NLU75923.1 hypothetical protein [Streptomyces sp. HNM0575]
MLDILVTVGVILVLIALAALLLHLIGAHHRQDVATAHYESFHPGNPPRAREREQGDLPETRERRDEGGAGPPPGRDS